MVQEKRCFWKEKSSRMLSVFGVTHVWGLPFDGCLPSREEHQKGQMEGKHSDEQMVVGNDGSVYGRDSKNSGFFAWEPVTEEAPLRGFRRLWRGGFGAGVIRTPSPLWLIWTLWAAAIGGGQRFHTSASCARAGIWWHLSCVTVAPGSVRSRAHACLIHKDASEWKGGREMNYEWLQNERRLLWLAVIN